MRFEQLRPCRRARRCRTGRRACGPRTPETRSPSACTSTGMCWTAWQASSSTGTPRAWASAMISWTGLTVPSAFETQATETSRVRSEISAAELVQQQLALVVDRRHHELQPDAARRSSCQGTMLAWCSIVVISTSSPGRDARRDEALRDQIDALGAVAREHDLARVRGVDEAAAPSRARPRGGRSRARSGRRTPRWMLA